ncbi:hypothetical protein [Nitratireductor alexandrii]|uniref:hypothetical protein n=1 Tax=Nitratireductor alexandrii TaxID=2448161 RepID=UPI000FD80CE8|nr:hypothetical protein [Nitratireductor alexandrii]
MATDEERLVVALEARIRDFERNILKANRTLGKQMDGMERRAKKSSDRLEAIMGGAGRRMGAAMKAGLAGLVAGGALSIAGRLVDVAGGIAQIGDEAKRAGLNVKAFQELKYVAEQNRIGVDSLTDGIKELNLRADEWIETGGGPAAESFARLGFTAEELKTKLKDPSALFTEIIGKLENLDRAARIRIADEIFGGTGGERFVQLIDRGERAIRDQIKAANDLGVVLDEELIERADEVDRKFRAITTTIGTSLKSAIVEATSALQTFIDTFRDIERQQSRTLNERVTDIGRERLEIENRILELKEQQAEIGGFTAEAERRVLQGTINELAAQSEQLAREEARILSILESRRVPDAPEPTSPAPGAPPARTNTGGRSSSARSSSTDSAARERQAVVDLIAELEAELRLIGASEAQQRAAAASRMAGAAATDQQRQRIIALNEAIYQETAALDEQRDRLQTVADAGREFVGGFLQDIRAGVKPMDALGNAIGRLADRMLDELLNAIFTVENAGSGNIFGGLAKFIMGIFGFADGGIVRADKWQGLRLADGGHVRGPGGPRDDRIPAMLSDGEFVVNAAATAKHRPLLEAVNENRVPAFAAGGHVGDAGSRAVARAIRGDNDNAVAGQIVNISAPVTVNASGGTPAQNADLAAKIGKQMEGTLRGVVVDEIKRQRKPGNLLNQRGHG